MNTAICRSVQAVPAFNHVLKLTYKNQFMMLVSFVGTPLTYWAKTEQTYIIIITETYQSLGFFFLTTSCLLFLFVDALLVEARRPWSTASSTASGRADLSLSYSVSLNSCLGSWHAFSSFFFFLSLASFSLSACWFIQFFNLIK